MDADDLVLRSGHKPQGIGLPQVALFREWKRFEFFSLQGLFFFICRSFLHRIFLFFKGSFLHMIFGSFLHFQMFFLLLTCPEQLLCMQYGAGDLLFIIFAALTSFI